MGCFWAAGYAATSVRDLGDAMGLGAASLYNAFGDKRTLFTQCLDRYLDANMRARITRVEKTLPPRQAIATFLTEIVERSLENDATDDAHQSVRDDRRSGEHGRLCLFRAGLGYDRCGIAR